MGVGASLTSIAAVIGTAATVAGTVYSMTRSAPSAPAAPPPIPAPAPMPVMDQAAVNKATQTQTALAQATSGRQATVLSQTGTTDKLGG